MAHTIKGYVANFDDLLRVYGKAARLNQGLGFVPDGVYTNDEMVYLTIKEDIAISKISQLAWIETDYFGGAGTQSARLWINGKLAFEQVDCHGQSIDAVLKRLGVKCEGPGGRDEFDMMEFGRTRHNEDFALIAITTEELQKRRAEWNASQLQRASDTARTGDYVKLLVQWSDISGIPLVTCPPGTILKVLYPDLTTGGIIVEYQEVTFSLKPDEYEITISPDE